jgi:hypothetical protein
VTARTVQGASWSRISGKFQLAMDWMPATRRLVSVSSARMARAALPPLATTSSMMTALAPARGSHSTRCPPGSRASARTYASGRSSRSATVFAHGMPACATATM